MVYCRGNQEIKNLKKYSGACEIPDPCFIYWDANVFLSYLNDDPERFSTLQAILEAVELGKKERIVPSVISKVEVTWVAHEKLRRVLSRDKESRIDAMWDNSNVIEMVDFNDEITVIARKVMRDGLIRGWKLHTNDAIHLASAHWEDACELQTYDMRDFCEDLVDDILLKPSLLEQPID